LEINITVHCANTTVLLYPIEPWKKSIHSWGIPVNQTEILVIKIKCPMKKNIAVTIYKQAICSFI